MERFLCDEMLGGLARWLRAAGYDTVLIEPGLGDGALVAEAEREGRVLLTSDSGVFDRNVVKNGRVHALAIPRATPPLEQLRFVLERCDLGIEAARCMACGGELVDVPKDSLAGIAPPRAFASCNQFWRCAACKKLYWRGTHWLRIERALADVAPRAR
jgi:uncharacterized protein